MILSFVRSYRRARLFVYEYGKCDPHRPPHCRHRLCTFFSIVQSSNYIINCYQSRPSSRPFGQRTMRPDLFGFIFRFICSFNSMDCISCFRGVCWGLSPHPFVVLFYFNVMVKFLMIKQIIVKKVRRSTNL